MPSASQYRSDTSSCLAIVSANCGTRIGFDGGARSVATKGMEKSLEINNQTAIQIAGPTASGKSALAVKLAQLHNGEVINTDSMQIYKILDVLTARPSVSELKSAPHHLYGHVNPGDEYSTGHWIKDVQKIQADIQRRGKLPIFVGGTGLYFKALNGGLSNIPSIPTEVRDKWRGKLETDGIETLYSELKRLDPESAQNLKPADKQRITRALEVYDATGKSIRHYYQNTGPTLVDTSTSKKIILLPDRPTLHERIENRFTKMFANGALQEVEHLLTLGIDTNHTSMKAIGVRELSAYIKGLMTQDEAIERSIIATRQYAKRQSTWFRNQLDSDWLRITNI